MVSPIDTSFFRGCYLRLREHPRQRSMAERTLDRDAWILIAPLPFCPRHELSRCSSPRRVRSFHPPSHQILSVIVTRNARMFLARQPGYESSSTSATEQGEDSPWSFLRPRVPGKCWARELAVIESWHSLLAERDVTVGNNQGGAWT